MKNKILGIILIITLIVLAMTNSASALSFTATMTPSATTVPESTEFIVIVKISNLDVGTNGINGLSGYLKYDADVFETVNESSIEKLNNWVPKFDESTGKISLTKSSFVTSSQEVFQITFKTKSGVSGKTGNISYTDIQASNSETNINATDISTSITVGTAAEQNTNTTSNTTSNVTVISPNTNTNTNTTNSVNTITSINTITTNTVNNTTNNTTNNTVSSYVNTMTNTTSEENMPKTGVDDTILMIMFVVIAMGIVFYVKIEKINNDMR